MSSFYFLKFCADTVFKTLQATQIENFVLSFNIIIRALCPSLVQDQKFVSTIAQLS